MLIFKSSNRIIFFVYDYRVGLKCPVCNEIVLENAIRRVTSLEAANHFVRFAGASSLLKLRDHINSLWKSEECLIFRCENCGSRFADPHTAGDAKFYELASSDPGWPESRWEFSLTVKPAMLSLKNGGRLLEIGAGAGAFIKEMIDSGVEAQRIAVTEFSSAGCLALQNLGVQVERSDFRCEVPGSPFKVIVLFQTLEHLDRLAEVISAFEGLGTQEAEIFLSVPNVSYIDWQEKNLGVIDMPPNHLTAFSTLGLQKLFSQSSYAIVDFALEKKNPVNVRLRRLVMHMLTNPVNSYQLVISRAAKLEKVNLRKLRILICAVLLLLSNWKWLKTTPPENIWVHLRRIPNLRLD